MMHRRDINDGQTLSAPACDEHPPYALWSRAQLALGLCPWCGQHVGNDPKVAREIRARELIGEEG